MKNRTRRVPKRGWLKPTLAGLFASAVIVAPTVRSAEADIPADEVKAIAEEAVIYGFPIVMNYKVFHDTFLDPDAKGYKGPTNQVHREARVYTSDDRAVQTPNSDTPYALLGADLRAEPLVICVPEVEKGRYFSVQMVDMYTHNYGYIGTRTTGNGDGCYLIAGPGWEGKTPSGVKQVYRCETPLSMVIIRTQLFDSDDVENVEKVQAGCRVQTLSAYLGEPAPPPPPEIEWPEAGNDIFSTAFPATLDFLLGFLPPTGPAEGEVEVRERLTKIGIGTGPQS